MSTAALHWYVPYEKLDRRQKDFVDTHEQGSNVFLQGPPGSGKTILLINIINNLRKSKPNQKIGLVTYTHSLIDMLDTGLTAGSGIQAITYHQFVSRQRNSTTRYDTLVVDEVQDIPVHVLSMMRGATAQLIVAGDGNQRIYRDGSDEPTLLSALGLTNPSQQFRIAVSYRLTPSVFRAARVFKPAVLNAQESTGKTDVRPELARAQSEDLEVTYIYKRARLGPQKGEVSAILFTTHEQIVKFANKVLAYEGKPLWTIQYETSNFANSSKKVAFGHLNAHFQQHGIQLEVVQNGHGSLQDVANKKRVVLQTYHSAKGLDYNNVYIPFLTAGTYIDSFAPDTLFYVAFTRSRAVLCLSYTGIPHQYLKQIEAHCVSIEANPDRVLTPGSTINFGDEF
jgi:superfamily I DNA/RNA helicase